jgi:hypothetical protein
MDRTAQLRYTKRLGGLLVALIAFNLFPGVLGAQGDVNRVGPPVPPDLAAKLRAAKAGARPAPATPIAVPPVGRLAPASGSAAVTSAPDPNVSPTGRLAPVLPPKDYAPPVLFIENAKHDFGSVFLGEEVTHTFTLHNKGGSNLVISQIKPSCGCTYVDHDKVIAPGKSGSVTLKIDTRRLRAGKQAKTAEVFSNDPKAPKEKLLIEGSVATIFTVNPEYPRIEAVRGTANPSTVIALEKTVDKPFKVSGVSVVKTPAAPGSTAAPPADRLAATLTEKAPGKTYEIAVTALTQENDKANNFYEKLNVDIVDESTGKKLTQEISVTVRFQDRISVNPRTVWFRRNEVQPAAAAADASAPVPAPAPAPAAPAPTVKTVTLKSEVPGFKFKITKVESSDPHFSVTQSAVRDGEEYQVNVKIEKLPEDPKIKSMKGDIKVSTDDPANPEITFRVIAYL